MTNKMLVLCGAFLLMFFISVGPSAAVDYKSTTFPSNAVLQIAMDNGLCPYPGYSLIGKVKETTNSYLVFARDPNSLVVDCLFYLTKTDANYWIGSTGPIEECYNGYTPGYYECMVVQNLPPK
jgi:hypothetical protein